MLPQLQHKRKDTSPRKKSGRVSPVPEDIHDRQLNKINKIRTIKINLRPMASTRPYNNQPLVKRAPRLYTRIQQVVSEATTKG